MKSNKIKLFEMFAGYGGASFALKKANIPHEVVGYSEIDKFAIKCYEQNHSDVLNGKNWDDCRNIDPHQLPDFDLLTGGFPCQPFSIVGKREGIKDERGLLFNDIIRIVEVKKPKFILLENVKGILTKTHKDFFEYTKNKLKKIGYDINIKLYNSKDYDTPQNRERVFYICKFGKLDEINLVPQKLMFKASQLLDVEPPESKYYRSKKLVQWVLERRKKTTYARDVNKIIQEKEYIPTIIASKSYLDNHLYLDKYGYRHFTPKELFRFMGFFNNEINTDGISDTQKYKLIGNGWDINLVSQIFEKMLKQE